MKKIFQLIKPRIILVNLIAVIGSFFFAVKKKFSFIFLLCVLLGTAMMIASGCIFNNIIDISIDHKMFRTKDRILIHKKHFIIYAKIVACLLFLLSIVTFVFFVNILSAFLATIGFIFYVIIYTYMKRISIYDIITGSIAGAMPPLIGYCSVTNYIDFKAILLFFLYFIWQIPHSYTIFIIHHNDYKIAKIPTIVIKNGKITTLKNIFYYIMIFMVVILFFYILNYINIVYFILFFISSLFWMIISYIYYLFSNNLFFLKLLFFWSIIVIFVINFSFIINYIFL
ncbi:heme o synthase [Buchnera aphidicola]|uniref:Protoheme IX farnesyltransferase n=1 Tax=Buchnera aphidicola (Sarucallis kahawaluokalani) TaxID=1241878 RepID=A0A4D6Y8U1_9GAMM|nr:heme o synthase [Buchnera aphidicola]QCI26087.1 protoheme IX farnesyltransferase [Buchnera aphidicola (Sarucallis kahawaluokalani)]